MHIIIPMSGVGNRFIKAGYKTPKPLIIIDEKPIIEHVCNLFGKNDKFTFICNSTHLNETSMRDILKNIKPNANIIEISNHKKGPVYAVNHINHLIDDDEEIIVNYCDFGTYWNYDDFLKHTRSRNADGDVVAYKGFHPHMLGTTNYAFMRSEEQWMLEIKEKEPFTNNRQNEYASNGTYYFKKGSYVKKYFNKLIENNIHLNGEYYVSLVYNLLVNDGLDISIYEIQHMLQWGTPEDVEEYKMWSDYFQNLISENKSFEAKKDSLTLIPLAGRGSRFSKKGYTKPKPLIDVSGKPMVIQASNALPKSDRYTFVTLNEHVKKYSVDKVIQDYFPKSKIISIENVTEGQAITCSLGLIEEKIDSSLLISASDNGIIYNHDKYNMIINNLEVDAVVFTFRGHVSSKNKPEMYGWVEVDNLDNVKSVSVKSPISENPYNDHAIVGTFWFRKIEYFNSALNSLIDKDIRVNNEFYVDSLINELVKKGRNVKIFEVDNYLCWGTPNDYETFVYWQSFFHKCSWHQYSLYRYYCKSAENQRSKQQI